MQGIHAAPPRVLTHAGFRRMLAAERMTSWHRPATHPENRRTRRNWQRADILHEHYRLGADRPGARLLHRRAQVPDEHYREIQTRIHAVTRTGNRDARAMTIPDFGRESALAERALHASGHIYDPAGVEARAGGPAPGLGHDMQSNFAWLLGAIHARHDFEMVGPMSQRSLSRGSRPAPPSPDAEPSALLREVQALSRTGYRQAPTTQVHGVPIIPLTAPRMPRRTPALRDLDRAAPPTMPTPLQETRLRSTGMLMPDVDQQPASARMGALRTLTNTFSNPGRASTWHEGTRITRATTVGGFLAPPPVAPPPPPTASPSVAGPGLPPPPPPPMD